MSLFKKLIKFNRSFIRNHGKNNHVFVIGTDGTKREIRRLKNSHIKFKGSDNTIEIYAPYSDLTLKVTVYNKTKIILKPSKYPRMISISGYANYDNTIVFGCDFSTSSNLRISLLRGNGNIIIGDDCMFAWNNIIQLGDGHDIYSTETNAIINDNKDIIIGNHVWVAADAVLLKGTNIADDSVIGFKSVVTKPFTQNNIIIAGVPAKIVKTDIHWTRESQY